MHLIDAHCHLDFEVFDKDRSEVLNRAEKSNISDIIIPGTQKPFWNRIKTLCAEHENQQQSLHQKLRLHACYGLHPYWTDSHELQDIKALEEYIGENKPVALGECGLDFRPQHIDKSRSDKKTQTQFFEAQLEIANNQQLPVVIHSVSATEAVIQSIKKFTNLTGMIHSYSGSIEQAKQLIDLNMLISVGGSVTYHRAKKIRLAVCELPLTSLLVETDAPDQSDQSHQHKRNEPAYLVNTIKEIAYLRNETEQAIAQQTTINTRNLFKI